MGQGIIDQQRAASSSSRLKGVMPEQILRY
jgi:hypothetical protein